MPINGKLAHILGPTEGDLPTDRCSTRLKVQYWAVACVDSAVVRDLWTPRWLRLLVRANN